MEVYETINFFLDLFLSTKAGILLSVNSYQVVYWFACRQFL